MTATVGPISRKPLGVPDEETVGRTKEYYGP